MNKSLKTSLLILFGSIILWCSSCDKRQDKIVINGILSSHNSDYIYLSLISPDGIVLIDSSNITGNQFRFEIKKDIHPDISNDYPAFYQLSIDPLNAVTTIAKPGETLQVRANGLHLIKGYKITGGRDAMLMNRLDSALEVLIDTIDKLYLTYNDHIYNDSIKADIESSYLQLIDQHRHFLTLFIMENSNSVASISAFYQVYNRRSFFNEKEDIELLIHIRNQLTKLYPNSKDVEYINQRIERISL